MGEILSSSAPGADYKEKEAPAAAGKTLKSKSHPGDSIAGSLLDLLMLCAIC